MTATTDNGMGGHMAMPRDHIVMMHEGLRICYFLSIEWTLCAQECHRDHIALLRDHMAMPSEPHGNA